MVALIILTVIAAFSTLTLVVGGAFLAGAGKADEESYNSPLSAIVLVLGGFIILFFLYREFGPIWVWYLHLASVGFGTLYSLSRVGRYTSVNWPLAWLSTIISWVIVIGYWSNV